MHALTVSLVQGDTRWLDAEENRRYYRKRVLAINERSDLIVLPEAFTSGFTNEVDRAGEEMNGATVSWLRELSAETGAVITGSIVVAEGAKHYNRLIWMRPDGAFDHYDKRHLFRMAGEHEHFAGGSRRPVFEVNGWKVLPQVCYDLRFPAWSRNRVADEETAALEYDVILFVANWPEPRRQAWRTLLRARAIENLSYGIGVNRVGTDGNGHVYAGDSAVIDPLGEALVELGDREQNATVGLDATLLLNHRRRFPTWMDADDFVLRSLEAQ